MTARGLVLWVFPPPRRAVTAQSTLPLILFLIAFLTTCSVLDMLDVMLFASPEAFFLTPIAAWFWWMHIGGYGGLGGARGVIALFIRLILVGLFITLLAQPRAVRTHQTLSAVFVLDNSASIGQTTSDAALRYVTKIASEKPEKDEVGLIVFGRDAAVEMPPDVVFPFEDDGAITVQVDRDGTNLGKSLSLAAALLPEEHQGRIILITDGTETEGSLKSTIDELKARKIAVDVLPVQYDFDHEVWIERLELPRNVKIGETYEAAIILSSLQAGKGTLALEENGRRISEAEIEYQPGKNRYVVPIYLREPGYYEYEASIEPPEGKDGWRRNNRAISYLYLRGEGKVLLVTNPGGDARDWQHFAQALREAERAVDIVEAFEFPTEPLSLLPYDCIVFVNVPADAFAINQFAALHDTVKNQGSGFLMIGGENSFGPGGYHRSEVEEILPVSMDVTQRKVMPKSALAITLHTCEFPDGNTWAKEITKRAIKVLSAQDEVGVLVYDWSGGGQAGEKWLFDLTPAGEYDNLAVKINQAQIGDMPSFVPTMQMALQSLKNSNASTKHMIIISDGDPQPPSKQLLAQFRQEQISVTTVAVFPHGNDTRAMQMIAQLTGGRFYFPQDASLLPSIFVKEAKTLKRSMIQNEIFTPAVDFPSPIIKGIDAMPQLGGYVLVSPKNRSTTILKGPNTEEVDPVLSTWRFGVGKTAAFTSDLSPNWAKNWINWEHYRAFIKQLMTDISRVNKTSDLRLQAFASGSTGVVTIEDYAREQALLNLSAQVSGPRGESQQLQLKQIGPRRYEGRFELWGEGRYQIMAIGTGGSDRNERAHGGFVVPYSHEYLRFRSNPIVLKNLAKDTGGRELDLSEDGATIFGVEREDRQSSKPIIDWFLIALACLVPLDVAFRRVQIDMMVVRGWFGRRKAPEKETFTTLLKRKQDVAGSLKGGPELVPQSKAVKPAAPMQKPQTGTEQATDDDESTTGRLLALKRKRQEDPEE